MTRKRIDRRTALAALAGLLVTSLSARADQSDFRVSQKGDDDDDHDQARRAFREGQVRSLSDILATVKDQLGGEVIDVGFEREGSRYVYEIKVLDASGRLREVYVDAASGEIMKVEDD